MTIRLHLAGQNSIKVQDGLSLTVCVQKNREGIIQNGYRHCVQNVKKPWEAPSLSQECTEFFLESEQISWASGAADWTDWTAVQPQLQLRITVADLASKQKLHLCPLTFILVFIVLFLSF